MADDREAIVDLEGNRLDHLAIIGANQPSIAQSPSFVDA